MKFTRLIIGFSLVANVFCRQLDINVEDILYGEDEEEEDEEGATTVEATTTTTTTTTSTTTEPTTTVLSFLSASPNETTISNATTLANTTTSNENQNFTLVVKPANGTIFGSVITPSVGARVTTERVHYVLGQVGNIWNSVGKLNITGIVDHSLGIRNNYIARPLVTGILNVVFCNPLTFSNNNCRGRNRGKASNSKSNNTQTLS